MSDGTLQDIKDRLVAPVGDVREQRVDGELRYDLAPEAIHTVLEQGRSETAGKETHRYVLRRAYFALTRLGLDVEIPRQNSESQPDAIATIPVELPRNPLAQERELDAFREDHPAAYALSKGAPLYVEAEVSTGLSAPEKTATNLERAHAADAVAVLVVPEGSEADGDHRLRYARAVHRTVTSDRVPDGLSRKQVRIVVIPDNEAKPPEIYRQPPAGDETTIPLSDDALSER